jgi:epoxyqueuosine reductase
MGWMAAHAERRGDPQALWPEAKSVVVVGLSYAPEHDPRETSGGACAGNISVYARGDDYHDVLKAKLRRLAEAVQRGLGGEVKLFVDTAPVMEKPLAAAAGIGWQGKHTNLVSRDHGSWLFLGALFTTLDLAPDAPEDDHCGTCRACLDACPTAAFPAPRVLDARRCISYLTIEHKGHVDRDLRPLIGNRIYGCDDCLAACPWNKFARVGHETAFAARAGLDAPPLAELAQLDDQAFRRRFAKSPIKRIKRDRFLRNVLVAIGNSARPELAGSAERLLADPSPLVRAMAVWALSRLVPAAAFAGLRAKNLPGETDEAVRDEWRAA